jgi:4-amino-4-deoxy-L-arabinose transferase-like glycosyltransferase
VRIVYLIGISQTGCLAINSDPISDMETFHRWANLIVEGDWLGRADFHPYHPWQRGIASEATWLQWYGPRVFHQDPLYPYFVALVYLVAPRDPFSVVVVQLFLGAAATVGIFLLAGSLFPPRAALAAGVLAALYGPFLFYESLLLRDTLLVFLTTVFLLLVERARHRGSMLWWAGAGLAAGAITLAKPNIIVFLPFLAAWMVLGREMARPGRSLALLLAGFLASVSPAVARNLLVGAPPLKTTTRGAIEYINGNNPYHAGIGWFDGDDTRVTEYARRILGRTRARLLPTVVEVLGSWRGRAPDLAWLQVKKLGYFLAPFEMPNNASFAYFKLNSWVLSRGLPSFFIISSLAGLGLAATAGAWRRLLPHYLFLVSGIALTVAFYTIARFRIPFLPLAMVFAGAAVDLLLRLAAEGRWRRLAASAALVIALLALNGAFNYPDLDLVRPQDYLVASGAYARRGDTERAAAELDTGRAVLPEFVPLHVAAARMHEEAGQPGKALAAYREAFRLEPGARHLLADIQRLEARAGSGP